MRAFLAPRVKTCFVFVLVSRSLFASNFEFNSGRWGSQNKYLVWEVLQKPSFRRSRNSDDFGVDFWCFSEALGSLFLSFEGLGGRVEIGGFFRDSLGDPGLRGHAQWKVKGCFRGAHQQQRANKTSSYNAITVYKATKLSKLQDRND